jgi:hypothetical protein
MTHYLKPIASGPLRILAGLVLSLASPIVADAKPARRFILVNLAHGFSREGIFEVRRALPDVAGAKIRVGIGRE